MSYKNLTHTIRDILEGKQEDPNAQDLAKLKKVAKIKDEEKAEEKLDAMEALEHGTSQAADQYAKDTPGQSAGHDHDPIQHQHKAELAVDGVPLPGGQLKKPEMQKGIKEDIDEALEQDGPDKNKNFDKSFSAAVRAVARGGKSAAYIAKKAKDRQDMNKKNDPGAAKKGLALSVVDREKAKAKLRKKMSSEEVSNDRIHYVKVGDGRDHMIVKTVADSRAEALKKTRERHPGQKVSYHVNEEVKNCGCGKNPCETYGKQEETVMMSGKKEKTMAAIKRNMEKAVDKANKKLKEEAMHEALDNLIQAYGLQEAMSAAERDARRDASKEYGKPKVDSADVDHDHKPEKKRGRGERDLPHIATQLRGVVDMGAKHSGVKFKDGSTKKVHPDHAASWLKKHDSAKPAQKLAMYKSHDSHGEFMKHK